MTIPRALLDRDVFGWVDAAALGVSADTLHSSVCRSRVRRLARGWFTAAAVGDVVSEHRLHTLVAMRRHPQTVAGYHSALVLLGLPVRGVGLDVVHLVRTGDGGPRRRAGVQIHARPVGFGDIDSRVGLPGGGRVGGVSAGGVRAGGVSAGGVSAAAACVPVAHACAQAALRDAATGLMAADAAVRCGMLAGRDAVLMALQGYRSHAGVLRARAAIALVDGRRESPGESECAYVCYQLGYELEPQVWLGGDGGRRYRVDAVVKGARVIVEYDGESKYVSRADLVAEKAREDSLRAAGFDFVRVTKGLVRDPARLGMRLRQAVERAGR